MANLLNFKFGAFANLPEAKTAGTVYVTTDEQAMYIDLPNKDNSSTIDRLRIGDIIVKDSVKSAAPPFAEGAFYYFVKENALVRWDGTTWKQINTTDGVVAELNSFKTEATTRLQLLETTTAGHKTAIEKLQADSATHVTNSDFATFKAENTAAIAEAKKAGTDANAAAGVAQAAAEAAQATANTAKSTADAALPKKGGTMSGDITMGGYKIVGLGNPTSDTDAATKEYVDDAEIRAKDEASKASKAAAAAQAAADAADTKAASAGTAAALAQSKADSAYTLAESKATMEEVEAKNYATKAEAQGYANTVLGQSGDSSTTATVYGAIKKAEEANAAASAAQQLAAQKVTMEQVEAKQYATTSYVDTTKNTLLGNVGNTENDVTIYGAFAAAAIAKEKGEQGIADAATALAAANAASGAATAAAGAAKQADDKAVAAQESANDADAKAVAANDNANSRVLQTVYDAFVETNNSALENLGGQISANGTAIAQAAAAASKAQTTADDGVKDAAAALARANEMLPLDGSKTMTGAIAMGNNKITGLAAPSADTDAANKKYVDDAKSAVAGQASAANQAAANALARANEMLPLDGSKSMTGAIVMGNNKITGLANPDSDNDAANKAYVDGAIAAGIKANDAMTFKGTVGGTGATLSELPTANVQKGDTYKVSAAGSYGPSGNKISAKVGDLIINVGADDGTPSWTHVSSGYEDDYLQRFVINNGIVYLTDGVNANNTNHRGSLAFAGAEGTNLSFAVTGTGYNATVTATLEWGTF